MTRDSSEYVDIQTTLGYSQAMSANHSRRLSYRDAGVDIAAADDLVRDIARLASATHGPEVLSGVGLFASAMRLPKGYRNPVLMTATDGVGTKLAVARLAGRHDTIGIDLVAMSVNDLLTTGARPLCFLDYISMGALDSVDSRAVIAGIADGCRRAGASLVGGETAEMPGFYRRGEYDLAGFAVGIVERRRMIDGSKLRAGELIVGLESSGLHSNGYSLARKALGITKRSALKKTPRALAEPLEEALLRPTRIYVRPVLGALERFRIGAMAHITGGGIPGNLVRVLPPGIGARINRAALPKLAILDLIAAQGNVRRAEMDKTFNAGIGYLLTVAPTRAEELCRFFRRRRVPARVIGEIVAGRRRVSYYGKP